MLRFILLQGTGMRITHERNPAFDGVILHVVLQGELGTSLPVKTSQGLEPDCSSLMPLLNCDLEAYATEYALLELEQVDTLDWVADFLEQPTKTASSNSSEVRARWEQKVFYARKRLHDAGWKEACHQLCLEVLGFAHNRETMSRIALQYPRTDWLHGKVDWAACFERFSDLWKLSGIRPANHPRRRLKQYAALMEAQSDWPMTVLRTLRALPMTPSDVCTAEFRKLVGLGKLRNSCGVCLYGLCWARRV